MSERPEVVVGQVYADVKEKSGRRLEVLGVKLQEKTEGRFFARYTYATVRVSGGKAPYTGRPTVEKTLRIDTDRLRSSAYRLVFSPCPATEEGTQDACPTPPCTASSI